MLWFGLSPETGECREAEAWAEAEGSCGSSVGRNKFRKSKPPQGAGFVLGVDMEMAECFGDELLTQILAVVRASELPTHRKIKSLVRAGKVGEMFIGALSDDCAEEAFKSCPRRSFQEGTQS